MLFDKIIFGPIRSRRFGISLGVNLIPTTRKICSFDCIYCECGWTDEENTNAFPSREVVRTMLEQTLRQMQVDHETPDSITFSGNGEPTLHPEFSGIINDTIALRNQYFSKAVVTVLSNSTMLDNLSVFEALKKVDNNTMKLDAGTEKTYQQINRCYQKTTTLEHITENLCRFNGDLIVQTLFLRGFYDGERIDNTTEEEIAAWIERLQRIHPKKVLLYPLDRTTPAKDLEYVGRKELKEIAHRVEALGIETAVYD